MKRMDGEVKCNPIQGPGRPFAEEEFKAALAKCASGKAAGPSGVATEMISASGETGIR